MLLLFDLIMEQLHPLLAKALMQQVQRRGWHGAVPHFRGCGGIENALPRAYHAGDTAEIRWILARLAERYPVILASAVSLGGSMLLNYLAEEGAHALPTAAAAISTPLDLHAASTRLDKGLGKQLYTRLFMRTLRPKALDTLRRYPGLFDGTRVRQASTFSEFDDLVTAPLHGFASARHYWQSASSKPRLAQIKRPTLVLNARNDPFLPAEALPNPADVGPSITLECPAAGGHVGFVTGPFPGQIDWLPQHILAFFQVQLAATPTT